MIKRHLNNMKDQKSFEVIVQESCAEKKEVVDKLQQRSDARLAEIEKKKAEKDKRTSAHEQTSFFNTAFNQAKQQIEAKLADVGNIDKEQLISYFDQIAKDCLKLQRCLSDSTMFLATYDIKIAQEVLKTLQDDIQFAQNKFIPKKKFVFKAKKKILNGVKDYVDHGTENHEIAATSEKEIEIYDCGFKDLANQRLEKYSKEIQKQDVDLHQLKDCEVLLYGSPSTLHISNLKNCSVFVGPVSTSVFIENCNNCTFILACQQLRIHTTSSCSFYLHITSRTIIEDCTKLQFAPYNWSYENLEKDFAASGLDKDINNWESIDDFNWLVSGVPSPNWSLLPESKYMSWG